MLMLLRRACVRVRVCAGHPEFLSFEDGFGSAHLVSVPLLKELFDAGGNDTQLVFVSACFSRECGEVKAQRGHINAMHEQHTPTLLAGTG